MTNPLRPCIICGDACEGARCPQHQRPKTKTTTEAGYDWTWRKLSKRARKLQDFCSDCGATDDLTCDHSPEAWQRRNNGLPIRLKDIDVVCRSCNDKRGPARGPGGMRNTNRSRDPLPRRSFAPKGGDDHGVGA